MPKFFVLAISGSQKPFLKGLKSTLMQHAIGAFFLKAFGAWKSISTRNWSLIRVLYLANERKQAIACMKHTKWHSEMDLQHRPIKVLWDMCFLGEGD